MLDTNIILSILLAHKYIALFVLVIAEGFFSIIVAGYLVYRHDMSIGLVLAVVVAADLASDLMFYFFGAKIATTRFGSMVGITESRLNAISKLFGSHGGKLLLVAKLSSYLAPATIAAAGMARMRISKLLGYCTAGSIPKNLALIGTGYYLGASFRKGEHIATSFFLAISISIVIGAVIIVIRKRLRRLIYS